MGGSTGDSKDRSLESAKQPKGKWAERADTGFAVKTQSEMSLINTEPGRLQSCPPLLVSVLFIIAFMVT